RFFLGRLFRRLFDLRNSHGDARSRQREFPRTGHFAQRRPRLIGGERDLIQRDALVARLLEVLGHDGAPQSLLCLLIPAADPSDVDAAPETDQPHAQVQKNLSERNLSRERHREQKKRDREKRCPCRAGPAAETLPGSAGAPARPTTPPDSASPRKSGRLRRVSDSSVGTERKRGFSPAALLPGFSIGRCQNRRQPQNKRTTGTIQAANPARA